MWQLPAPRRAAEAPHRRRATMSRRPRPRRPRRTPAASLGNAEHRPARTRPEIGSRVGGSTSLPINGDPELSAAMSTRWTRIPTSRSTRPFLLEVAPACRASRARPRCLGTYSICQLVEHIDDAFRKLLRQDGSGHRTDYTDHPHQLPVRLRVVVQQSPSNGPAGTWAGGPGSRSGRPDRSWEGRAAFAPHPGPSRPPGHPPRTWVARGRPPKRDGERRRHTNRSPSSPSPLRVDRLDPFLAKLDCTWNVGGSPHTASGCGHAAE